MRSDKQVEVTNAAFRISNAMRATCPDAVRRAARRDGVLHELNGLQSVPEWWILEAKALYQRRGFLTRRRQRVSKAQQQPSTADVNPAAMAGSDTPQT
jgi:hypothetical protein